MTPEEREALVGALAAARRDGHQVAALPAVPADAAEAYAVQAMVAERLGWAPLGWKIAATTPAMRARLRMAEPIFGRSFARFRQDAPARLPHAALLDPIVEAEFLFRLAADLPPRAVPYAPVEVAAAVTAAHVGIEVAECRLCTDPKRGAVPPLAVLADGSGNGRYVIGPEIPGWRAADLPGMVVTVTVDGTERRRGSGAEVMGDPLLALTWLANRLPAAGIHLRAGEWVSTGTASGMLAARAGTRVAARFGALPEVVVEFAA